MSRIKEVCPKCGSSDIEVKCDIEYALGGYYCCCNECGQYQTGHYSSIKDAVKSWNDRTDTGD